MSHQLLINGISGKWDLRAGPVSGKPTYQDLAGVGGGPIKGATILVTTLAVHQLCLGRGDLRFGRDGRKLNGAEK